MNWKIEHRTHCKVCNTKLPDPPTRWRTYCSEKCRDKFHNQKNKDKHRIYQQRASDKKHSQPSADTKQCLLCGLWYVQVLGHVFQRHHITEREYKEEFDLPLKRGVIPDWYRELKSKIALENKSYLVLEQGGMQTRYKKGDPRAKVVSGWKGRAGSKGYVEGEVGA